MLAPDSLHVCIALGPVAMYALVIGAIHLSARPLVTSGRRDAAALAVALSGLVAAGPMELFMVESAAVYWGAWVWPILLAAYALCAALIILVMRPRLVIYNVTPEVLRPVLEDVVARLDSHAAWAGDSLVMPQLDVQLHIEPLPILKTVQLIAAAPRQEVYGWRRLELELAQALRGSSSSRSALGVYWLGLGLVMACAITWYLASDTAAVAQAWNNMLRR